MSKPTPSRQMSSIDFTALSVHVNACIDRWRAHGAKCPLLQREICLHVDVRGLDALMEEL
jgi:hypothetical protein